MTSEPALFSGIYANGAVAAQLSDDALLQAMLDVEAALARACAAEQLIPAGAADRIVAVCVAGRFDAEAIGRGVGLHASPVVGLVAALREAVGKPYDRYVHFGATSQDIVDTALMLVASRALSPMLVDAEGAADAAAALADAHRRTQMVGRTLLQQALPTSFGLRAATWTAGLDASGGRLRQIKESELPVQMGGPVGTRSPAIATLVAAELGLVAPVIPWQAIRVAPATLAGALGNLAGVVGKIARDVTLLAQQEVGELRERAESGRGGSTAMSHKHNPVAAVSALACSKRVPGLVGTLLACMEQEYERAAGAWQAEWGVQIELLGLTGSAATWCRELFERLDVDAERMRANLDRFIAVQNVPAESAQLDASNELIDRALAAHRSPRP